MPVLRRGPNLYLRQTQDRLVLSSEHRAASASAPVYLELVGTDTEMAHLEVVAELKTERRRSLEEQAVDLLSHGAVLTRAKLGVSQSSDQECTLRNDLLSGWVLQRA